MSWRRTAAICAGLLALPSVAQAQGGLTGSVRYLAGYTHQTPPIYGSPHDLWSGVVPEVSYLFVEPRWLLRTTYAFTAAVHSRNPTEIANRLSVASSYELSRRTSLLLSGDANQTSLSNYLITRPLLDTTTVLVPASNSRLLTATASQGLTWEASPSVLLGQNASASYVTSLDPDIRIENFFATAVVSLERTWKRDALGAELRGGYTSVDTPPTASGKFVTVTLAPRWRHDLTPSWSTTLVAGASVVVSPESGTDSLLTPAVRAAVLYAVEPSTLELSYAGGASPNVLTGQMLRSHLITLRGLTALSERYGVRLGGSVGYLNGTIIDLRTDVVAAPTPDVNAFLGDIDLSWQTTDWLQLFGRGQFLAQDNGANAPASVREAVLVGAQFSTSAPDGVAIPLRFPQRVDRGDAPPRP